MADEKVIEYKIKDEKNFLQSKDNEIRFITQKNRAYKFEIVSEIFQFTFKLNMTALLTRVQVKVEECDHYQIEFLYQGKKYEKDRIYNVLDKSQKAERSGKARNHKVNEPFLVDMVNFTIKNSPNPRASIIYFIIIKGIKDEKRGQSAKKKVANVSDKDIIDIEYQPSKKKEIASQREVFKTRATTKKTSPQELLRDVQMYGQKDRHTRSHPIEEEDTQLRKAIQLSKIQTQRKEQRDFQEGFMIEEDDDNLNYTVVDLDDKMKKVFEHVNRKWLESQKKAQKQRSVKDKHSILTYVRPKIFRGCQFAFGGEISTSVRDLKMVIKESGGEILEAPRDRCYFICQNMKDRKVGPCKNRDGIKYVLPSFILDSVAVSSKCQISDYRPK